MELTTSKKGFKGTHKISILGESLINKRNSPLKILYESDFVFGIINRKVKVIKSRSSDLKKGDIINDINSFSNLISYLILNFIHPAELPTIDEVIREEIKDGIKKFIKGYNHEVSNM